GGGQPLAGLEEHAEQLVDGPALGPAPRGQGAGRTELHGQERPAVDLAGIVNGNDVAVSQMGEGPHLAEEAFARPGLGVPQELDGDAAVEVRVVGAVDDARGAAAQVLEHEVPADRRPAGERRHVAGVVWTAREWRGRRLGRPLVIPVTHARSISYTRRDGT